MSSSPLPVLDAGQRAWRYWFADGLPALVAGLCSLSFGIGMLNDNHQSETPLSLAVSLTAVVLYGAIMFRHREIVEWLKIRIIYPRTGYVRPPFASEDAAVTFTSLALSTSATEATRQEQARRFHSDKKRRMVFVVGLLLLVQIGLFRIENSWIFTVAGIFMAAALWIARKDYRLSPVILLGFPVLGFSMTIFFASRVTASDRFAWFLVGGGVLFILDGASSLVRYIVHNPAARTPQA